MLFCQVFFIFSSLWSCTGNSCHLWLTAVLKRKLIWSQNKSSTKELLEKQHQLSADSCASMSTLQMGHFLLVRSHWSTQSWWKRCIHGRRLQGKHTHTWILTHRCGSAGVSVLQLFLFLLSSPNPMKRTCTSNTEAPLKHYKHIRELLHHTVTWVISHTLTLNPLKWTSDKQVVYIYEAAEPHVQRTLRQSWRLSDHVSLHPPPSSDCSSAHPNTHAGLEYNMKPSCATI